MINLIPFRDRVSSTVKETCWATGLGRTTLYELIKERRVAKKKKIGRRTVILCPDVAHGDQILLCEAYSRRA